MALPDTFFLFPSQLCSVRCSAASAVLSAGALWGNLHLSMWTIRLVWGAYLYLLGPYFLRNTGNRETHVFVEVLVMLQKCRKVLRWYLGVLVLLKLIKKLCWISILYWRCGKETQKLAVLMILRLQSKHALFWSLVLFFYGWNES